MGIAPQQIGGKAVVVLSVMQVADLEVSKHCRSLSDVAIVGEGIAGLMFGRD